MHETDGTDPCHPPRIGAKSTTTSYHPSIPLGNKIIYQVNTSVSHDLNNLEFFYGKRDMTCVDL